MKKVLTVKDIQEILEVCPKTAYKIVHEALLKGDMFRVIKLGNTYRMPTKSFLDWLDGMEE